MIKGFFQSPSNRAGLSVWLATVLTAFAQSFITHTPPPIADLLGLVIGFVAIVQPDNSVTAIQLAKAILDVRTAVKIVSPASINAVIADAEGIVASVAIAKPAL